MVSNVFKPLKFYSILIFSYLMSDEKRHEVKLHYHHKLAEEEAAAAAKKAAKKLSANSDIAKTETTAQEDIDKLLAKPVDVQKT